MTDLELRAQRRLSMTAIPERISLSFAAGNIEMRAKPNGTGGTSFRYEGYFSTFDQPFEMWDMWGDPYTEVVRPGAFSRTLANNCDTAFLIGHVDAGILMARTRSGTMTLSQDSHGGHCLVPAMDGSREDVRALASAVERGDMTEMSCAFVTRQQEWSPDYMQRSMLEMDLNRGDVSAVVFGANPWTAGSSMTAEQLHLRRPVSARMRPEVRAAFEVDSTDGPDYNPQPHAKAGHLTCPSGSCTVAGGAINSPDAKHCDQCGAALYSEDGTIILGDSGVPEEVEGDASTALALNRAGLELRRRRLALLGV
jgi:HK97 family phage prohead protease